MLKQSLVFIPVFKEESACQYKMQWSLLPDRSKSAIFYGHEQGNGGRLALDYSEKSKQNSGLLCKSESKN